MVEPMNTTQTIAGLAQFATNGEGLDHMQRAEMIRQEYRFEGAEIHSSEMFDGTEGYANIVFEDGSLIRVFRNEIREIENL